MQAQLYFVHALTPLHAGTGQGVGVIDLPIAREKATGIPYLPGSSVKGVLRDQGEEKDKDKALKVFGPEPDNADAYAGAIQISDARLLALPVRSLLGTFAWVTSPLLLRRFQRDGKVAAVANLPNTIPEPGSYSECLVSSAATAIVDSRQEGKMVYLEDLDLKAVPDDTVNQWASKISVPVFSASNSSSEWNTMFSERLCIVHDDVLGFLLETATEVVARIKLKNETKTVDTDIGGLWYEEALPAESILVGMMAGMKIEKSKATPQTVKDFVAELVTAPLQFGGSATVGRGICNLCLAGS